MEDELYEKIRKENIEKYGTNVNKYGPVLLQRLYSDRTQFIYELIQNAEDACERDRKNGAIRDFYLFFNLHPDRLDVWHNGIPFNEDDVRGICGIVAGTKTDDYTQIGKFGIGFKSVYAYTISPEIYSNNGADTSYFFCINDYVHPYKIKPLRILDEMQTLIRLPFNHENVSKEEAYNEIKNRLMNLDIRTPLFLRNLEEISWKIGEKRGKYFKKTSGGKEGKYVDLSFFDEKKKIKSEKWLVFEKELPQNQQNVNVEIAFLISNDDKGVQHIVPSHYSKLYAYFSTKRETHLKFIIQGPYQTTVGRENIMNNSWNKQLIDNTADLLIENISTIKKTNLLDISFLNTLPIEYEYSEVEDIVFKPFYTKVKQKLLSNDPILPKYNGGYIIAKQALIGRTKEIRDLLSPEQLIQLLKSDQRYWLDENITIDKTPNLRDYLMKELKIPEITAEMFARYFNKQFIINQTDEWIISFYIFLTNQSALWRPKSRTYDNEGPLHSKPIIRLENGIHTKPFDEKGHPLAFLPSEEFNHLFPIVKKNIARNYRAESFLKQLGIKEPDSIFGIMLHVIPKYEKGRINVSEKDNIQHVQWIIKTIKSIDSNKSKQNFYNDISKVSFLFAKNQKGILSYKKANQVYLGEVYSNNKKLDLFFEDNEEAWFLHERYKNKIDKSDLILLGCNQNIKIQCKKPSWNGHVTLTDYVGYHKRGLDGFDLEFHIDGLKFALENITYEKALIIWDLIINNRNCIHGTIETSSRQDFLFSNKEDVFSEVGRLLIKHEWLPNIKRKFLKPSEIMLTELPDDFDKKSVEAKYIAEKLHFLMEVDTSILEKLPENTRNLYKEIVGLSESELKKALEYVLSLKEARKAQPFTSIEDAQKQLEGMLNGEESISEDTQIDIESLSWKGLTAEEEEQISKEYGKELPERWEKIGIVYHTNMVKESRIIDRIDPKAFLLSEYEGHCQICNTRLNIGGERDPIIWVRRLIEKNNKHPFANMEFNIMGLCPNCHTLLKYGNSNLRNIVQTAKKVYNNEIAPEEVKERSGDYYIIKIIVVDEEKELFYSPTHMQKLSAFISFQEVKKGNE